MERSIEIFGIILLTVIGLSHLLQPRTWAELYILLRSKGEVGAFIDGFIHLPVAALIIGFHDVWSGIPVLLTLLGWAFLIKSLLRFCVPKLALLVWSRVSLERASQFQVAGVGLLALAGILGYDVYAR